MIYSEEIFQFQLKLLPSNFPPSCQIMRDLIRVLNQLGLNIVKVIKVIFGKITRKLGCPLKKEKMENYKYMVCGVCGLAGLKSYCNNCGFNGFCCGKCGICTKNKNSRTLKKKYEEIINFELLVSKIMESILEKALPTEMNNLESHLLFLSVILLDLYQEWPQMNSEIKILFEKLYKNPKDPRNLNLCTFYERICSNLLQYSKNDIDKHDFLTKSFKIIIYDMFQRIHKKEYWISKDLILLRMAQNMINNLKGFMKKATFTLKELDTINSVICYFSANLHEAKVLFIKENIVLYLTTMMNFTRTPALGMARLNDSEYLEPIFRLLEILCFDKEFVRFNTINRILDAFYRNGEFIKKFNAKNFAELLTETFNKNKPVFCQCFDMLCIVKMDKKNSLVVKLKKGIYFYKKIIVLNIFFYL